MSVPSYGSPLVLGHRLLEHLWDGPVIVQEKVDGSQFSFMLNDEGEVTCRSKGQAGIEDTHPSLFGLAIQTAQSLKELLRPGYVYRAEAITSPKHNTIAYSRIPKGGLILYDIDGMSPHFYKDPDAYSLALHVNAAQLGIEVVPTLATGSKDKVGVLERFLIKESCLGGATVEGVVIKNLMVVGQDKKPLMGKLVRADFKEENSKGWKLANPGRNDFVEGLIVQYTTPARWRKAMQHLRDKGEIAGELRDIPKILAEVRQDILNDCQQDIKNALFTHFWGRDISRGVTRGFAEWYKDELKGGTHEVREVAQLEPAVNQRLIGY